MARTPASDGMDGVGKSGSPAPRSITSSPAALRRFASCEIAMVAEVSRCCRLGERPEAGGMRGRIAAGSEVGNCDNTGYEMRDARWVGAPRIPHPVSRISLAVAFPRGTRYHPAAGSPFDNRGPCDRSGCEGGAGARPGGGAGVSPGPGARVAGEHAAALDTLLGEAHEARRLVLSWNPALLADLLERHARRPLVVGTLPVDENGASLAPVGRVRYCVAAPGRRPVIVRDVLDGLDAPAPFVWDGGPMPEPEARPDAVVCTALPSREELAALVRLGEPVVFVDAAQLPYLRSIATLTPFVLPGAADRARDRAEELRERVARGLQSGGVDAELALLDPLFERFDPAEVAGGVLGVQGGAGCGGWGAVGTPPPPRAPAVLVSAPRTEDPAAANA